MSRINRRIVRTCAIVLIAAFTYEAYAQYIDPTCFARASLQLLDDTANCSTDAANKVQQAKTDLDVDLTSCKSEYDETIMEIDSQYDECISSGSLQSLCAQQKGLRLAQAAYDRANCETLARLKETKSEQDIATQTIGCLLDAVDAYLQALRDCPLIIT